AGLKDPDAHVRRAAADGLGRHPESANVGPLLELRRAAAPEDTHLIHVVRMSLRDNLALTGVLTKLPPLTDRDRDTVADVALGIRTGDAAAFLAARLPSMPANGDDLSRVTQHIGRYGTSGDLLAVGKLARDRWPRDLGLQVVLLRALERGSQERG